jgi:hypothetical protein
MAMAQSRVSGLDETTNKYPTITIAIIGHGKDLINELLEKEDPNIRIFSRAGQPFCIGIAYNEMLNGVKSVYYTEERIANMNAKSSYQMLREVAEHYNNNEDDRKFKELCDGLLIENPNDIQIKHAKKTIECKKHNQIYTPIYDHVYYFTDNSAPLSGQNGIHVIETINHISRNNINFEEEDLNLALKKLFIKKGVEFKKGFFEEIIIEFLEKFNLGPDLESNLLPDDRESLERLRNRYPPEQVASNQKYKDELDAKTNRLLTISKITRYSKAILQKYPFTNPLRLIREFISEDSEIHEIFNPDDDIIIKAKAKELHVTTRNAMIQEKKKAIEEKNEERAKQIEEKIQELRNQKEEFLKSDFDGLIESIKLSQLISFLQSEGFVVINIIDFTCRVVHKYLDEAYLDFDESKLEEEEEKEKKRKKEKKQETIREYEEEQLMGYQEVKQNIGGRKKRRTKRKKSKNSKKGRKSRKTRRNRK